MRRRIISAALSIIMAATAFGALTPAASAEANTPQYRTATRQMEKLNRGLIAVKTTADTRGQTVNGVYLSWRLLGDESLSNQAFDIYRDGKLIHTTGVHDATNYIDTSGTASNSYQVVKAGESIDDEPSVTPNPTNSYAKPSEVGNGNSLKNSFSYVDIPIDRPDPVSRVGDGSTSYYYSYDSDHEGGANDGSVGDLDGDGDYELVLKWDPTDSKDSAGADYTGNVYIDGYELDPSNANDDGTHRMWRIDMGKNVTAGAHYTQFIVYDFDGDGKSEIAMKTAPGTIDGTGHYVSEVGDTDEIRNVDNTEIFVGTSDNNYLGTGSSSLKGKNPFTQYLTIFDGETGAALWTTEYIPYTAAENKYWGDGSAKYNRSERYLAAVAYLDGVHPSIIMCRGYYDDSVIRAYNWDGSELTMLWEHVGKSSAKTTTLYGQGNHNLSIGDIDNDGKDEIVYGSAALDDDGTTVLGNTYLGHGDAMHMNDFNNDGVQEVFSVKEKKYTTYAEDLRVASTGAHFWESGKITTSGDNGRGVMDNIDDAYASTHSNALAIGWSSGLTNAHDLNGDDLATKPGSAGKGSFDNFLVFWDGDLSRELLDANIIQKYSLTEGSDGTLTSSTKRFYGPSDGYSLTDGSTNNFSKRNYTLVADIWGDWREEIIMPINKGSSTEQAYLRVYTSTLTTDYRLTTLMHDCQYRESVAWQNVAYNQPTHTSYYIGSAALATDDDGNTLNYLAPAVAYTNVTYDAPDQVNVTGISIDDSCKEITVERGKTASVTVNIEPEDATKKGCKWESSDTSVAKVANGIVTAVGVGTATITATSKDTTNGTFSDTCTVTVTETPPIGVSISDKSIELGAGYTKTLTASVIPSDATDQDIVWTSSDSNIASVDGGVVTGVNYGKAVITASSLDGSCSAKCEVVVKPITETDVTGEDEFVTSSTLDDTTAFTGSSTGGSLTQSNAASGAEFHKDFTVYSDNKTTLSFRFTTGGMKVDGSSWNWDGHEYTMGLSLLDSDGNNIVTFKQPYATKAGTLTAAILDGEDEAVASTPAWSPSGNVSGNMQGSAKRWKVDVTFDNDNNTCTVKVVGTASDWTTDDGVITRTFDMGDISFKTLKCYTEADGTGTIYAVPSIANCSYTYTQTADGSAETLYSKGGSVDWSESDITDWTQVNTDTAALSLADDSNRILYNPTKPGTSYSASKTFDIAENAIVTYDINWYFGNANNRDGNFEYLQIGNLRLGWTNGYKLWLSTDGGSTWLDSDGDGTTDDIFTGANETYSKNVQAVYNTIENTVTLSFDGTVICTGEISGVSDANTVSFGFERSGATDNWEYPNGLDSISVSQFAYGENEDSDLITVTVNDDTENGLALYGGTGTYIPGETVVMRRLVTEDTELKITTDPEVIFTETENDDGYVYYTFTAPDTDVTVNTEYSAVVPTPTATPTEAPTASPTTAPNPNPSNPTASPTASPDVTTEPSASPDVTTEPSASPDVTTAPTDTPIETAAPDVTNSPAPDGTFPVTVSDESGTVTLYEYGQDFTTYKYVPFSTVTLRYKEVAGSDVKITTDPEVTLTKTTEEEVSEDEYYVYYTFTMPAAKVTVNVEHIGVYPQIYKAYIDGENTVAELYCIDSGTVIAAQYDENGALTGVKVFEISSDSADDPITFENFKADKIFVWDSVAAMTPTCESKTVTQE